MAKESNTAFVAYLVGIAGIFTLAFTGFQMLLGAYAVEGVVNLGEMFKLLTLFLTGAFCLIWATLLMIYDKTR